MSADVAFGVLLILGAVVWLGLPAFLAGCVVRERRDDRAEQPEREETTAEWLAVLAAVEPTPVYDALVCDQMERAEGWVS